MCQAGGHIVTVPSEFRWGAGFLGDTTKANTVCQVTLPPAVHEYKQSKDGIVWRIARKPLDLRLPPGGPTRV